jgi:hypothetical protein
LFFRGEARNVPLGEAEFGMDIQSNGLISLVATVPHYDSRKTVGDDEHGYCVPYLGGAFHKGVVKVHRSQEADLSFLWEASSGRI